MKLVSLYPYFKLDNLNSFIVLAIGLFSVLTLVYSLKFIKRHLFQYYTYIILTALAAGAAVLTNNLLLLSVFWGVLGLTLYLLVNLGENDASSVAKKTFIIVGGSDVLMLLGIGIIYYLTGTFQMDRITLHHSPLSSLAYLLIAIAGFAKAGAMPFHSWIPDYAQSAPVPVVAYLPASLDKLLGIYLLARISLDLFVMNNIMNIFLMLTGAFTIIAAVMMAIIQHNMKRLLGYHAVSQVGYMVLGIGTGNPLGIAGGIFHMLNHAIYKSGLFLTAGNVEINTQTTDLDKLGGLARIMPVTYISCLIASLAISGVPPFNGFFSKWMVYQGLIEQLHNTQYLIRTTSILCLVAAMFGSALTLASFMKLIHATFLSQRNNAMGQKRNNEVSWTMWFPPLILAIICAIFGIFANEIPLKYFIFPAVKQVSFLGTWGSGLSTFLIIAGLIFGLFVFRLKALTPVFRQDSAFTGGEVFDLPQTTVSGTEFYQTIKEFRLLQRIYKKAEEGLFDIYTLGKKIVFSISRIFQFLHNGILPTYLVWCLLGMLGLFFVMVR
ncbi:MAG: hypothetical protein NC928_03090 [Candidatus Omnitrophica bacterium]|nr:hypothetical protein [Candidatus Omnitrophota bacterium]